MVFRPAAVCRREACPGPFCGTMAVTGSAALFQVHSVPILTATPLRVCLTPLRLPGPQLNAGIPQKHDEQGLNRSGNSTPLSSASPLGMWRVVVRCSFRCVYQL